MELGVRGTEFRGELFKSFVDFDLLIELGLYFDLLATPPPTPQPCEPL
jgi:hypothetical protein